MDEKRKGEIALALLKYHFKGGNIRLTDIRVAQKLDNLAGKTGIPQEEIKEFARIILGELLKEVLG